MAKGKGGGIVGLGLDVAAIRNSDGTVWGAIKTRYTYSLYIILGALVIAGIAYLVFKVFGHVTPAKEPFENEVKDRPMFNF
jgi:hypothetical protein